MSRCAASGDAVFKTDQELALADLMKHHRPRALEQIVLDSQWSGRLQRNGFAEHAVQSLEEMIRVRKLAFESVHSLVARMVEHCADVLSRYSVGEGGRTPCQRLKGRKFAGHMLELASSVMLRVSGHHGGFMCTQRSTWS